VRGGKTRVVPLSGWDAHVRTPPGTRRTRPFDHRVTPRSVPYNGQDHTRAQLRHYVWLGTAQILSSLIDRRTITPTTTWGPRCGVSSPTSTGSYAPNTTLGGQGNGISTPGAGSTRQDSRLPQTVTSRLLPQEAELKDEDSKQAIPSRGVGERPPLPLCRHGQNSTATKHYALT
jgi:hypothetical protein